MGTFVFIDTNRIVHDWLLDNPSAKAFLEGSKRLGFHVRIPAIVIDEAVNKFEERLRSARSKGGNSLQQAKGLIRRELHDPFAEIDIETEVERYRGRLESRITGLISGNITSYPSTPHEEIAQSAIDGELLFQGSDGYRDRLIWESIKEEINSGSTVFLVSSDDDFFNKNGALEEGLQQDLEEESIDAIVEPYRTLPKFNDAHLNQELERLENVRRELERGGGRAGVLKQELQTQVRYRLGTFDLNRERGLPDSWINIELKDVREAEMIAVEQVRKLDSSTLLLDCRFRAEPLIKFAEDVRDTTGKPGLEDRSEIVQLKLDVSATLNPDSLDLKSLEIRGVEAYSVSG